MAAPVNRTAIQIARGTFANLSANIAEFEEGELLYAKDQNLLYIIENSVMVALGGTGSGTGYGARILVADAGNADTGADAGLIVEDLDGGEAT